jgi:hypothetical protein
MENRGKVALISVSGALVIIGIGVGLYFLLKDKDGKKGGKNGNDDKDELTKDQALNIIVNAKSGRKRSDFATFDEWFLNEWANAIRDGKPTWVSKTGRTHSTQTARVVTA